VGGSSRLPGHLPGNRKFDTQLGLSAAVVSLGKKLYSHCLSHPAVKLGSYCVCNQGTAEKQLHISDVVIPAEKSQKKKKNCLGNRENSLFANYIAHYLANSWYSKFTKISSTNRLSKLIRQTY